MAGEVRFVPSVADHVAGQRLWARSYGRRPWPMVLVGLLALGAFVVAVGFLGELIAGKPFWPTLSNWAVPLFVPAAIFLAIFWARARVPGAVRRTAEQQPSLLAETTWRWDDEMLVAESEAGLSRIMWRDLYRWLADADTILVTPQERLLYILPRRVLDEAQAADLIATMERFAVKARRT